MDCAIKDRHTVVALPPKGEADEGQGGKVEHKHDPEQPAPSPVAAPRRRVLASILRHESSFRCTERTSQRTLGPPTGYFAGGCQTITTPQTRATILARTLS